MHARSALLLLIVTACARGHPAGERGRLAQASLAARLAASDPRVGARLFGTCAACHTIGEGTGDRNGPNLHGVFGAAVGHNSPSFGYSAALQSAGGAWTPERLDRWLTDPQAFAPGTRMGFPGLANGVDRADLIAYLAEQSGRTLPNGRPPAQVAR